MSDVPCVSVVMPVYNGEIYLKDALQSILNQSLKNIEIIIVNDGSTDNSIDIIESFSDKRIKLINQENRGLAKSLNTAVYAASAKYIARMDADDICHKDRLLEQFNFLEKNSSYVIVGTNALYIDKDGVELYKSNCFTNDEEIKKNLPKTPFFHSSVMFLRDVFVAAGGYFEKIPQFGEDAILWNKMSKYGKFCNLEGIYLKYRIVPSSITAKKFNYPGIDAVVHKLCIEEVVSDEEISKILASKNIPSKNVVLSNYYLRIGKIYLEHNFNRALAVKNLLKSIWINPKNYNAFVNIFLATLPKALIFKWKNGRGVYRKGM